MKTIRKYLRGHVLRAADDDPAKPLTIVAATAGRKGDGLNLQMDGADLERFLANPVVGYGHNYWGRDGLPIGRSDRTWIDDDRLLMDVVFDQADDFAKTVERKYRDRFLSAFSIGFDVWDIDDAGVPAGWELYEVSAVPLPMDPNAVVEAGRAADLQEALTGLRAGKVLSKKNKELVQSAADALQALLAASGDDDQADDDERGLELERLRADNRRLARLARV